ncbi:hypothetical protein D3C81_515380 [compost metagenome]
MKARIEKKLSKKVTRLHPTIYRRAWVDREWSELAYEQRTCVSHVLSVGGGTDYWGDGCEAYTVWSDWRLNWAWHGPFEEHPIGHDLALFPNTEGFRATTRNLLKLAAKCELAAWAARP